MVPLGSHLKYPWPRATSIKTLIRNSSLWYKQTRWLSSTKCQHVRRKESMKEMPLLNAGTHHSLTPDLSLMWKTSIWYGDLTFTYVLYVTANFPDRGTYDVEQQTPPLTSTLRATLLAHSRHRCWAQVCLICDRHVGPLDKKGTKYDTQEVVLVRNYIFILPFVHPSSHSFVRPPVYQEMAKPGIQSCGYIIH
jgi:hypothetical protein